MIEGQSRRFMVEGTWVITGQLLSGLGTLLGLRVLTDLLSPHVFGEVVLVTGIVLLASGLAASPLMQGVLRYYPEAAATNGVRHLRAAMNRYLTTLTILASAICFVGFLICNRFVPVNPWLGILVVGLLILDVIRQRELTLFNAARRQRVTAIWIVADVWARPALAYGMIMLMGATAVATLVGFIAASLILILVFMPWFIGGGETQNPFGTGLHHSILAESNPLSGQRDSVANEQQLAQALMRYSLPLMPLGVIGWISGQADRYLMGGMIGAEQVGIYAAIYGIVSRPFLMAGGTLESWIRPVYYEAVMARVPLREKQLFHAWSVSTAGAAAVGVVAFSLWHNEIANVLLAPSYRAASWLMPWIAVGYGLLLVAQVYERVCYAHNDTKAVLLAETIGSMVALIATVYGLMQFGFAGAAYAVPVYFSVQLGVAMNLAHRAEGRKPLDLWAHERSSA